MERASRSARVFAALLAGVAGTVLTTGSALADPTPSPPPHVPDANIRAGIVPILPATTDIPLPPSLVPLESESTAGGRITVSLSSDVLFDFDKATLTPHARRRITELAGRIRRTSGAVRVEGHTDAKGTPAYNLRLSRARAAAVKAALEQALAGSGVRIVAVGHGEARPVAPNTRPDGKDDPAGRAKNRRVTVTFQQS
ncbi:OmpA family protein [Thermomonospora amylolytica]|uniref:OmpA family protein n=1 Tax=Thermomonospora amylolytica TaxID=1411117 RepID=UPI000E6C5360|nr:OmpA family protein [Thermomonospora amylolytica]